MLIFGVIGYVLKKLDYPLAPLVLALVLGDRTEEAFRQSLLLSEGSLAVFFHGWLSGSIMTLGIVLAAWPVIAAAWPRRRAAAAA
jgi:TctA family transporter